MMDVTIGDKEVKDVSLEQVGEIVEKVKKGEKISDREVKVSKDSEKRQKIDTIKAKESSVFEALKSGDYDNLVSDCYSELDTNLQMVTQKLSYGFICEGKGGTGKTFRILNKCKEELDKEDYDYADSFTTPTALFVWMYENRDKEVLVLDDCAGLMDNGKILAMLKGALWHLPDGKTRLVTYMSTKPPKDEYDCPIPRSFVMNARIVIITNFLDDENAHVKAILSRVNKIVVEVPRSELLRILEIIIQKDYHGLSMVEKTEVLNYLEEKTSNMTEELNIRTLLRMMDYKLWANKNGKGKAWQPLCLKLLQKDDRIALVEEICADPTLLTEDDRLNKFIEKTGASRATYFRVKRMIKKKKEPEKKEEVVA